MLTELDLLEMQATAVEVHLLHNHKRVVASYILCGWVCPLRQLVSLISSVAPADMLSRLRHTELLLCTCRFAQHDMCMQEIWKLQILQVLKQVVGYGNDEQCNHNNTFVLPVLELRHLQLAMQC